MSKKSCFRGPLEKKHVKWDQKVLISKWHHVYHVYWLLWRQLVSKKCLLVIRKTWRVFFNTLTAGHKYSFLNRDNLTQPTEMQLSLKGKTFFSIFFVNLWHVDYVSKIFKKKYDPHRWYIFEVTHSESLG